FSTTSLSTTSTPGLDRLIRATRRASLTPRSGVIPERWRRRLPGTFTPEGAAASAMDAAAPGNVVYGWGPTFLGAPHDNLPTAQGLDAEGEATNGQGPVAYPGSPELLNRHGERHVLRMATWKADELSGHVQGRVVEAPFPARNFAEDVPRKGAAELVNTIYVPPGRAVRIERGVNSERGGPLRERGGVHDGRAPAIDG